MRDQEKVLLVLAGAMIIGLLAYHDMELTLTRRVLENQVNVLTNVHVDLDTVIQLKAIREGH